MLKHVLDETGCKSEAAVGDLRWVDGRWVRIDVGLIIQ